MLNVGMVYVSEVCNVLENCFLNSIEVWEEKEI